MQDLKNFADRAATLAAERNKQADIPLRKLLSDFMAAAVAESEIPDDETQTGASSLETGAEG